LDHHANPEASSYQDFLDSIHAAGYQVTWNRTWRTRQSGQLVEPTHPTLVIDGDHSYEGAKKDLDGFFPHLVPMA